MQIKTIMKYHFMPTTWLSSKSHIITVVGKNVEKLEPSHTAGVNIKWYSYFGKVGQLLKRLKRELQHDPAIALLGIYIKEIKIYGHTTTCTQMFTAPLVVTAKKWKHKCPSTDEWINSLCSIRTMEYYLVIKEINAFCFMASLKARWVTCSSTAATYKNSARVHDLDTSAQTITV